MSLQISPKSLHTEHFQVNSLVFDAKNSNSEVAALFTHGYTASKTDCINWANRIADLGIDSIVFDQPGHRLGGFNKIPSFETYKKNAHKLFIQAFESLKETTGKEYKQIIFGGHSLGAMLSIKALELEEFSSYQRMAIGIGIGISQHKTTHLFESDFYQRTLTLRRQLVEKEIDSDLVFPWIKEEKQNIQIKNQRIHLITGTDDVVVGAGGMQAFETQLLELGNNVTTKEPSKLPHHEPSIAATHVYAFLKKEFNL